MSPLMLNGPLVRLGDAKDLVREGASTTQFELEIPPGLYANSAPATSGNLRPAAPRNKTVKVAFQLRPTATGGTMALNSVEITIGESGQKLSMGVGNARREDIALVKKIHEDESLDVLHLKSTFSESERPIRTFVAFAGLVPVSITKLQNEHQIRTSYRRQLSEVFTASTGRANNTHLTEGRSDTRRLDFFRAQEEIEILALQGEEENEPATHEWIREIRDGRRVTLSSLESLSEADRDVVISSLTRTRANNPSVRLPISESRYSTIYSPHGPVGLLEQQLANRLHSEMEVLSTLRRTLKNLGRRVQYIGPLRDEPRVVWSQWNEQQAGLPVGLRGELSASVLSRMGAREIRCTLPGETLVTTHTLQDAVNAWLSFLQLANGVSTLGRGKLGVEVSLQSDTGLRDLTSVGVGVSQTLPIVVALLIAPQHSILIIEQPELHLHPAVQARLADFLLSARPDMSIVAETHSEALVTRIRRRVAEDKKNASDIQVLFVESGINGATSRELLVNKMGDLSEWPRGFLSDMEEDTRAIIMASINRSEGRR